MKTSFWPFIASPSWKNSLLAHDIRIPRYAILLAVILLVAFDLRMQSVRLSEVDTPLRADAMEYLLYAYNIRTYGVYSRANTLFSADRTALPQPDAVRAPLYPLFVSLFLDKQPTTDNVETIKRAQAIVSTFTVLLVFWLARNVLSIPLALAAAGLTALSPHLVTMNIYILSETLFAALLVAAIYLLIKAIRRSDSRLLLFAGMVTSAAALTHPMLLYVFVPLSIYICWLSGMWRAYKTAGFFLLGFCLLYGPWIGRNLVTLGAAGDNQLMLAGLSAGVYRDLMYEDRPETYGYPYRYDPEYTASHRDMPTVARKIARSFEQAPLEQTRWYLLGKPLEAWSWALSDGSEDIFLYPVTATPYRYLPHFAATRTIMQTVHWWLVTLMALGIVLAWMPPRWSVLENDLAIGARVISLVLLYHLLVMIAGFPLVRYAIPMRCLMHIMAMLPVLVALKHLAAWRLRSRVVTEAP